jgi:hypothetical protein
MEVIMPVRIRASLLLFLSVASFAVAGNKKKVALPAYVLKARTVVVLIDPDAGINPEAPLANKTAQEDVEKALAKWGRLSPVLDAQTADLVIIVRRGSGRIVQQTVGGMPTNDRPVIVQPNDTGIRIGAQQGRSSGAPPQTPPQDTRPVPQTEVGNAEDVFTVYEGHSNCPPTPSCVTGSFDQQAPAWRYTNKNALRSPNVPAVDEFRKLVDEAEKQQKTKP